MYSSVDKTIGGKMAIEKQLLSLAAEYTVAAEICRYGIYAQLTLGPRKRTDILLENEKAMLRIQVKAKQTPTWPNCKGICGSGIILVLVDFKDKTNTDRPDFYILTPEDWKQLVETELKEQILSKKVRLDEFNVPVWVEQLDKKGNPYKGCSINPGQVAQHQDQWFKIFDQFQSSS